ncbi:hypothetical protein F907_01734 [Acinetobacter colistiniresistens]|uniref:Beta-lactamase n=1 Tax=Acinetobacter colistiniresistens TaxID=280145 RepID=S3TDK5_9GAMM|nr:hypothetical protein F907_01734 [Acinetobacter colistiniresistens]
MRSLLKSAITVVLFGSSLSVTMAATLEEQVKSLSEKGWQVGVSILDMENKRVSINGEPYRVCRRVNILRDYPDDKTKLYPRN